jgi:hypothetical protein
VSEPPLPGAAVAMLRKPNSAVITTLRPERQPVSTATWYLWDGADLADIDRLAQQYMGGPYPQRERRRISAWIAVDGWHGWGALKDSSQPG